MVFVFHFGECLIGGHSYARAGQRLHLEQRGVNIVDRLAFVLGEDAEA